MIRSASNFHPFFLRYVATNVMYCCLLTMGAPTDGWNGFPGQCWTADSCDITADASTNNAVNPPITSNFDFYVTLTAELADDISLRHIVLTFKFHQVY